MLHTHNDAYQISKKLPKVEENSRSRDKHDYTAFYGASAVANREFLNIGAGKWFHPVWKNVDFWQPSYEGLLKNSRPEIDHDLSKLEPIKVADESVHLAYTSHTIEHIQDHMTAYMFKDAYRFLRPGGLIRITCPNAELAWYAMKAGDIRFFRTFGLVRTLEGKVVHQEKTIYSRFAADPDCELALLYQTAVQVALDPEKCERAREILRTRSMDEAFAEIAGMMTWEEHVKNPGRHINWYSPSKVVGMLKEAGFKTALVSGAHQSVAAVLRNKFYFDKMRPNFSLYVEAIKD